MGDAPPVGGVRNRSQSRQSDPGRVPHEHLGDVVFVRSFAWVGHGDLVAPWFIVGAAA